MMEASFPDPEVHDEALLVEVLNLLPPQTEAQHLCEVYLEYGKFLWVPYSFKCGYISNPNYADTRPSRKRNSLMRH